MPPIHYRIIPIDPHAHLYEVSCTVAQPDPAGQIFSLPVWIPGSYMVREFAKNVVTARAEAGGKAVPLNKLDKSRWQAAATQQALTLVWQVYAWDLSVRTAHLDASHGFFNGTSVFPCVEGQADQPCVVDILRPDGEVYGNWRIATTLSRAPGTPLWGFGPYQAANYDELVDHPVEMGTFAAMEFEACGVPHAIAITGRQDADLARLARDLKRICEWQINFFGQPAPMDRYLFLVMATGDGYGGLEHRASTALLCSRHDLPTARTPRDKLPDSYLGFLGLCSHEYFHTWNVKRIKPAAFAPYDLSQENYTRLLWAFEGFTSYYDDLCLVRCGLITPAQYLEVLAKTLSNVQKTPGRQVQSLAESSFEAWTKYYRQDENTPNAVVSYYTKGALTALCLDLQLRASSQGERSLDTLMAALWVRYGQTGIGLPEEGLYALTAEIGGPRLGRWLKEAVEGTADLPLERLLKPLGVSLNWETSSPLPSLGALTANEGNEVKLSHVFTHGPAQLAGLSAGDVLLAWNRLRITATSLDKLLARHQPGDQVDIHAFRRDELIETVLKLDDAPRDKASLAVATRASPKASRLQRDWLGGTPQTS